MIDSSFHRLIVGIIAAAGVLCAAILPADDADKGEVVVYTALDKQFSEPILKQFEARTGVRVRPVFDTEAAKTVGLVNRLLAERHRPRADVFWNNEILRSIQLKEEGLTESYHSPSADTLPDDMKDPDGHWTGFAARARVFMVNRDLLPDPSQWPRTEMDLVDPKWKGKYTYARPLFGTTNTHAAVIWSAAGEEKAKAFWDQLFETGVMAAGNAQARDAAAAGEVPWCWTDTDDAFGAIQDGYNVEIIYPEEGIAGAGTLVLPNTLVLIRNSPNPGNGRKLIDFLLSEEVEAMLAASRSAQIPVRESVPGPEGIPPLPEELILEVDWMKTWQAIAPCNSWLNSRIQ